MFWRVELDKTGAILTCDLVQDKGRNGGHVIFVEAETKSAACSNAKAWHQNRKDIERAASARKVKRKLEENLCLGCGLSKEEKDRSRCRACQECANERQRLRRMVPPEPRAVMSAEQRRDRYYTGRKDSDRRRVVCTVSLINLLDRLDKHGPTAFRSWLVSEIARKGGVVPVLNLTRDPEDFESALYVYDPVAQAAE